MDKKALYLSQPELYACLPIGRRGEGGGIARPPVAGARWGHASFEVVQATKSSKMNTMSQDSGAFWGEGLVKVNIDMANERREDERGYRFFRNASFAGIVAVTGLLNTQHEIHSMPPRGQLLFNAVGLTLAIASAAGFERGRRRMERAAENADKRAEEIAGFDLGEDPGTQ